MKLYRSDIAVLYGSFAVYLDQNDHRVITFYCLICSAVSALYGVTNGAALDVVAAAI